MGDHSWRNRGDASPTAPWIEPSEANPPAETPSTAQRGTSQRSTAQHGTAQHGVAQRDAALLSRVPLPRRERQTHLAPQLREDEDMPNGTPFSAFTASVPGPDATADRDTVVAFRDGSRRARGRDRNST